MKLHLLVIDPQKSFTDPNGSLFVPGADKDTERLAQLVERLAPKLDDIHVTLDSHRKVDISHPMWWKNSRGERPSPFTLISAADIESGLWDTYMPSFRARSLAYLQELERRGRYCHTIWPEHCLIGDEGHNVDPKLSEALHGWEERFAQVEFVTKGSNPWTEHFSAVQAEVPDPADPSTQLNTGLVQTLEKADIVLVAGQALSHCLLSTMEDTMAAFSSAEYIKKMILLTDATSPVPDPPGMTIFSDRVKAFLAHFQQMGGRLATTDQVLR